MKKGDKVFGYPKDLGDTGKPLNACNLLSLQKGIPVDYNQLLAHLKQKL